MPLLPFLANSSLHPIWAPNKAVATFDAIGQGQQAAHYLTKEE